MKRYIGVFTSLILMVAFSCSALAVSDNISYESVLMSGALDAGICIGHDHGEDMAKVTVSKTTDNKTTEAKVLALTENIKGLDGAFDPTDVVKIAPLSVHPSFVAANDDYRCHNWRRQYA